MIRLGLSDSERLADQVQQSDTDVRSRVLTLHNVTTAAGGLSVYRFRICVATGTMTATEVIGLPGTLSPTRAIGNCLYTALIEGVHNRAAKGMGASARPRVAAALRKLKQALYDAYTEREKLWAPEMRQDDALDWMQTTWATTEAAHRRHFAFVRDSPCGYKDKVDSRAWEGVEATRVAAMVLQTLIYLAMEDPESTECTLFKVRRVHEGTAREAWHELQLSYEAWWMHLANESQEGEYWPPVLHHSEDHYSSIILSGAPTVTQQATLRDFYGATPHSGGGQPRRAG